MTATGVSYGVAVNQDPIHIARYAFEISFLGCFSVKFGKLARASCRTQLILCDHYGPLSQEVDDILYNELCLFGRVVRVFDRVQENRHMQLIKTCPKR